MKVYSISSNLYSNSCQTDSLDDLASYIKKVIEKSPPKTMFIIGVTEVPSELWAELPAFEGFKMKSEVNNDQSD